MKGMNFLHKSDLKCHGNLTSKNCVINSRWTVKLQEFGLVFGLPSYCEAVSKGLIVDFSGTVAFISLLKY
jgi:tRNA A-37 threonylcarbamoyl transferase component Bud32